MLPLLRITNEFWNKPNLENVVIIGAQHILESTLTLFRFLRLNGLKPKNTFLIGKCYSSSPSVACDFEKEGFFVDNDSFYYESHQPFDVIYQIKLGQFTRRVLSNIKWNLVDRLVVLDDGGYLIKEIHKYNLSIPVVCIEQTSSGYHLLKSITGLTTTINVARSKTKLEYETPFIIDSCLQKLYTKFPYENLFKKKLLILGRGSLGREVLKYFPNADYHDQSEHTEQNLHNLVTQADFVFGCSGSTSLPYIQYSLLKKNAVLCSFSSSDREFEAHKFRQEFPQNLLVHRDYARDGITLLHSGFPINFWGSRNNISLDRIQITLALLQAAIYQASTINEENQGLVELDPEYQTKIISAFCNIKGAKKYVSIK